MVTKYLPVQVNKTMHETGPRGKSWMKPTDQMDLFLDSEGYYRKHTAKDGSCLYRAVSEQVYLAQAFHLDVRRQCAEFAQRHPELLKSVNHCSPSEYVEHMKHPYESGGKLELQMMSLMYKKEFSVFSEVGKSCEPVTNNGFDENILLCLSQDRHYDSVFTKQYIATSAFCQSLVYEMLYKKVFELLEVDYAVKKMLHDKSSKSPKEPSNYLLSGLALQLEIRDSCANVKELLMLGVTPFPYKVAKSLDPDIYRNVEYDTWNDMRRGIRYGAFLWNNKELQVGVKCHVKLQPDQLCMAHIQEMAPNKGPVLVFIEELGKKMTVPYESLELLPQPPTPPQLPLPLKHLKQLQTIRALAAASQGSQTSEESDEKDVNRDLPMICESERDRAWGTEIESDGKISPKLKMISEMSKFNKKLSKPYLVKSRDNQQSPNSDHSKNKMDMTSIVSSSDCNYQLQRPLEYQSGSYEDYNCHNYINQEVREEAMVGVEEGEAPQFVSSPAMCVEPQHFYYQHQSAHETYPAFCFVPPNPEMPVTGQDVGPVRFYCNYGFDVYSRSFRPAPPCYLNPAVAYVPEPTVSSAVCDQSPRTSPITTPDPAVVMSSVPVYPQRPDSLPVLPTSLSTTTSSADNSSFNSHNIAPRFKNKQRAAQGRSFEVPVIQQPEVSSTTNVPMASHYVTPPPPPPLPLPPQPAPTVYHPPAVYHPVECDAYFPATYTEYSLYDPNTGLFYPHALALPPPQPHYIHPESGALFYQHVVPSPLPPPPTQ